MCRVTTPHCLCSRVRDLVQYHINCISGTLGFPQAPYGEPTAYPECRLPPQWCSLRQRTPLGRGNWSLCSGWVFGSESRAWGTVPKSPQQWGLLGDTCLMQRTLKPVSRHMSPDEWPNGPCPLKGETMRSVLWLPPKHVYWWRHPWSGWECLKAEKPLEKIA